MTSLSILPWTSSLKDTRFDWALLRVSLAGGLLGLFPNQAALHVSAVPQPPSLSQASLHPVPEGPALCHGLRHEA